MLTHQKCALNKLLYICLYNILILLKQYKYLKEEKKMLTHQKCALNKLLFASKNVLLEFIINMVLFVGLVMICCLLNSRRHIS